MLNKMKSLYKKALLFLCNLDKKYIEGSRFLEWIGEATWAQAFTSARLQGIKSLILFIGAILYLFWDLKKTYLIIAAITYFIIFMIDSYLEIKKVKTKTK